MCLCELALLVEKFSCKIYALIPLQCCSRLLRVKYQSFLVVRTKIIAITRCSATIFCDSFCGSNNQRFTLRRRTFDTKAHKYPFAARCYCQDSGPVHLQSIAKCLSILMSQERQLNVSTLSNGITLVVIRVFEPATQWFRKFRFSKCSL
ncbi:uncharacterized protein LOC134180811 [Corticium candelabrum]|uniref:uncharacterized protein LOC134180811 n=1 Tax=Corticium candelabrum TaxID=121492 RepID=UPI002E25B5C5|nr:uncharacterized protein LOC134180811 [Corticium candelabrum]